MGKQGTRRSRDSNEPGVKKCTTELTTSLEKQSDGNQAQGDLPAAPSRVTPAKKNEKDERQKWSRVQKTKWSRVDYKKVMYAFHMSLEKPGGTYTEITFRMWKIRNHNVRINLNTIFTQSKVTTIIHTKAI